MHSENQKKKVVKAKKEREDCLSKDSKTLHVHPVAH